MFGISMEKKSSTLRLIYPQWQGACIAGLVPEVKDPDEASRGYYLGAELLNFLAPDNGNTSRSHFYKSGGAESVRWGHGQGYYSFADRGGIGYTA